MKRWPVILVVLLCFVGFALARNYSDFLGLPMSYLYNDAQFLQSGASFTNLSTVASNGYVFVSNTNGIGIWTPTNQFSAVGMLTTNFTPFNSTSVFFITNGLITGVRF